MSFENLSPQIKALIVLPIIGFVVYGIATSSSNYQNKEDLKKNVELSFNGVITEKYLEEHNRNAPFLKFKNDKRIYIQRFFWDKLKPGDSIDKKSGDSLLYVYRKNEIILLDYNEYFSYWDSIYRSKP